MDSNESAIDDEMAMWEQAASDDLHAFIADAERSWKAWRSEHPDSDPSEYGGVIVGPDPHPPFDGDDDL